MPRFVDLALMPLASLGAGPTAFTGRADRSDVTGCPENRGMESLVGAHEIAHLLGVTRQRVHVLSRTDDFP